MTGVRVRCVPARWLTERAVICSKHAGGGHVRHEVTSRTMCPPSGEGVIAGYVRTTLTMAGLRRMHAHTREEVFHVSGEFALCDWEVSLAMRTGERDVLA